MTNDDDDDLIDAYRNEIDLRSVSVIWTVNDDQPSVVVTGCSAFEAYGLATFALQVLGRMIEPDDDTMAAVDDIDDEDTDED